MSAHQIAKERGIDIETLFHILSYRRPYKTDGELAFIELFLDNITGMSQDMCGNRFLLINNPDGSKPDVIWSCHTDTVHSKDGRQNLRWMDAGNVIGLNEGKPGQCLGADDGAGMWLLLEMIKVNKPGFYIFHRGEERGGIGSGFIRDKTPELVKGYKMAIAFDRRATHSIITRQRGGRCCSDDFAKSLAKELMKVPNTNFRTDPGGTFTDTANYTKIVPECTNVSVGYDHEHGPRETLDVAHLIRLRDGLLQLDVSKLVIKRDPSEVETYTYTRYSGPSTYQYDWKKRQEENKQKADAARYEKWLSEHRCDGGGDNIPDKPVREYPSVWTKSPEPPKAAPVPEKKLVPSVDDQSESFTKLLALIERFPEATATFLLDYGLDEWDLADHVLEQSGMSKELNVHALQVAIEDTIDEAMDDEDPIQCVQCYSKIDMRDVEGNRCPICYADLTRVDLSAPDRDLVDAARKYG